MADYVISQWPCCTQTFRINKKMTVINVYTFCVFLSPFPYRQSLSLSHSPAYSYYLGVFDSLHIAVCVCARCYLICHTCFPHRSHSTCHCLLLHPEILQSGVQVWEALPFPWDSQYIYRHRKKWNIKLFDVIIDS